MSSHPSPKWAHPPPPSTTWQIQEIKSQTLLFSHPLNRASTTFGRAIDAVCVPTNHESCSRVHARIAFDKRGVPWLRDLGSTHGTVVNKQRLPKEACGKSEDGLGRGSRGVVLYPGDRIVFGASSRVYRLDGPVEYSRGYVRKQETQEERVEESVGRMMQDDEEEEEPPKDEPEFDLPLESYSLDEIPEKHRKSMERIQAKKYKLSKLQLESERIQSKQMRVGELTAGQTSQLEKNAKKEELLREEILRLETVIRDAMSNRSSGADKKKKRRRRDEDQDGGDGDYDVDDFYDRTKHKKQQHSNREAEEGETEESLTRKWKQALSTLKQTKLALTKAQKDQQKLQSQIVDSEDYDVFFLKNQLQLANERVNDIKLEINNIEKDITGVEQCLLVCNENLLFCRDLQMIENKLTMMMKKKEKEEKTASPLRSNDHLNTDTTTMPPPIPVSVPSPVPTNHAAVSSSSMHFDMPPPPPMKPTSVNQFQRRKAPIGPTMMMMPPPPVVLPKSNHTNKPKIKNTAGLSTIQLLKRNAAAPSSSSSSDIKNTTTHDKAKPQQQDSNEDTTKKVVWKPPKGQDGSGITKLNQKFAGRY